MQDHYGIQEEDLVSAEIEVVPAGRARDLGFDRSLVGAYGQDDRVCAYAALAALLNMHDPEHTGRGLFFDKEEIGSEGSTGAKSFLISEIVSILLEARAEPPGPSPGLMASRPCPPTSTGPWIRISRRCTKSGMPPAWATASASTNTPAAAARSANDATAEYVAGIGGIFNAHGVVWQTGELGRVDEGGGGTVAKFLAEYGMDIVDSGPALAYPCTRPLRWHPRPTSTYINKVVRHMSQFPRQVVRYVPGISQVPPRGRPMGLPPGANGCGRGSPTAPGSSETVS